MSENKKFAPTPSQLAAINVSADKILVSAAAGAGKSTVLTERIIKAVTDTTKKYDLQKLMVVTFTRASAEDLRAKITAAVNNAVKTEPDKLENEAEKQKLRDHLNTQLMKLPSAKINTIHGVCYSIIKANFEALPELPASIGIADENTVTSLKIEVMNDFIEYCYSGLYAPITQFDAFVENFVTERDDNIVEILLNIYDKILNCPNGFDDFNAESIDDANNFLKTEFGFLIYQRLKMLSEYYLTVFNDALEYSKNTPEYNEFIGIYSDLLEYVNRIINAAEQKNLCVIRDTVIQTLPEQVKCPPVKNESKTVIGEQYKKEREDFYKEIVEFTEKALSYSDEQLIYSSKINADISKTLLEFLKEYDRRFKNAKLKRSYIDFNDLERYTLKLLYNEDGTYSDFAKRYSSELTEIYVDEFQDLNPLQNKIFEAFSLHCPIFMVGDIKQSIYGFRGADPEVFAKYKREFPKYDENVSEYKNVTVFLSENFRSLSPVLDFTNIVSDAMFYTPEPQNAIYKYRIPYNTEDRLKAGIKTQEPLPKITHLNYESVSVKGGSGIKSAGMHYQARMVAAEIKNLVVNNNVEYRDIAIIMRNLKTSGPIFEEAFKLANIPLDSSKGSKLFDMPEIQLALCLLNCCDNPYRDIFLAGALKSPIFAFTLGDLITIKNSEKQATSLFDALCSYTERTKFEKGKYFLSFLEKIRKYAMDNSIDRLLWYIFEQTKFFSLIYDGTVDENGAKARRANLLLLHEMAKTMTDSKSTGLYDFVESIRLLIEQDKSPYAASTEGNGVKIMTMHASKGLEYPYCFVCGISSRQRNDDINDDVLFYPKIGAAVKIKDELRLCSTDTPMRTALSFKNEIEWLDEEMRLLYVALTRAKNKLYICSSETEVSVKRQKYAVLSRNIHPYWFVKNRGFFKWILFALNTGDVSELYEHKNFTKEEIIEQFNDAIKRTNTKTNKATYTDEELEQIFAELKDRLTFEYPHKNASKLPSKLSVSRLVPDILDSSSYFGDTVTEGIADYDLDNSQRNNSPRLKTPRFLSDNNQPSGADKGTATHIFMQFCDFKALKENGIEAEIRRLTEKRFIKQTQADIIDRKVIEDFLESELFKEMLNAPALNREYRFNIKLPASDFTKNEELKASLSGEFIFVQGIIDCYFYNKNGNITMLDYKTDFVPDSIKGDTEKENEFFISRHSRQLGYYKTALEILTEKKVEKVIIYSFALGRNIELNL